MRDAVELLGYRHNLTASTLRRADRQSASIGLIFEDVSNPFFGAVHRGVEDAARERGVLTLVGSSDEEPERERELAEAFSSRGVDGLIVATRRATTAPTCCASARPAWRWPSSTARRSFIDADAVVSDNAGGARDRGRAPDRRRATAGSASSATGPEVFTAAERLRGYRETLAQHGLAEDLDLVRHPRFRGVDAYETTCELLRGSNPPTALFASQNLISVGAVRAVHALGLQHEVAMVSFDDILLADALDPGLTVVAQDPHTLGRTAAELVFSRLDGYDGPSRQVVVPTQLIERGSGELPPRGGG